MVVLAGDNLLLWHRDGRAQLRGPSGGWSDVWRLPVDEPESVPADGSDTNSLGIMEIIPDAEGMLILEDSHLSGKGWSVLLTNLAGTVVERWIITSYPLRITSDNKGRRVLTADGVISLLSQGALGNIESFPADDSDHTRFQHPLLFEWHSRGTYPASQSAGEGLPAALSGYAALTRPTNFA